MNGRQRNTVGRTLIGPARRARTRAAGLAAIAGVVLVALTGCLQSELTVTVQPDGSGVVEERFLMRTEFAEMMAGMASASGAPQGSANAEGSGDSQTSGGFSLLDKEQLREDASRMGEGVQFESAEAIETDWGRGYRATYRFSDISTLRVNQNPGDNLPQQGMSAGPETETTEYVQFDFQAGNPAVLNIRLPDETQVGEPDAEQAPGTPEQLPAEQFQELMQFYRDMRIAFRVQIDGSIVGTNATHRDGNTLTLMDLDFNAILNDEELATSLLANEADSLAELQKRMTDVPGVTVESRRDITVKYR